MEEQSVQDAQLSIRGAKHTLTIYTTNLELHPTGL
jgi:hypothetical protein